jgi:hypothetical protein
MQTTPNIGLQLPATGATGWAPAVNFNFSTIDTAFAAIPRSTPDFSGSCMAQPLAGVWVYLKVVAVPCLFAGNFAGSVAYCGENPTVVATLVINKNDVAVGALAFSTAGVASFTTPGGVSVYFSAGDRMTIVAPTVQDVTLGDLAWALLCQ